MLNLIIPIYNSLETLPKALDSLVAQTKKMFLVTIVNDNDSNDYSNIINEYIRRGLHINYIKLDCNCGPGVARQAGIDSNEMCDYIMFMDSDDMLNPRAIEVLYKEAKIGKYDIVISQFISEHDNCSKFMDARNNTSVWLHGKIYRRAYLINNDIRFNPNIRLNEDVYFNNLALNLTDNKIGIDEITYIWRNNKNSLTRKDSVNFSKLSGEDFLKSAIDSMVKINSKGFMSQELLVNELIIMYEKYMEQEYFGIEKKDLKILEEFGKLDFVRKCLNMKNTLEYIAQKARSSLVIGGKIPYFAKLNFEEWLNLWYKKDVG